jgi:hypothetical protein
VEALGSGASAKVVDDGLKSGAKSVVLHDMLIKIPFFGLVSFELCLESYDILGEVAGVLKLGERGRVVEGSVYGVDRFVVEEDMPQLEGRWWKAGVVSSGKGSGGESGKRHDQRSRIFLKGLKPRLGKRKNSGSRPSSKAILISSKLSRISYTRSRHV